MSTSETINEIAGALAKAQGEMKNAPLNKTNPHFKSRYADLAAVRDATVPILSKHGLSVIQYTEVIAAGMLLHTRLLHTSGQWIEGSYSLDVETAKPQAIGSALSYGRRYCLASMCGIASEEDDDANAAQEQARTGNGKQAEPNPRFIYEGLVNTMRSTKTLSDLNAWRERKEAHINALPDEWHERMKSAYQEHKASLAKPAKLSEQAIESDLPPMPDDAVPF